MCHRLNRIDPSGPAVHPPCGGVFFCADYRNPMSTWKDRPGIEGLEPWEAVKK
jgi:hypothetical protein